MRVVIALIFQWNVLDSYTRRRYQVPSNLADRDGRWYYLENFYTHNVYDRFRRHIIIFMALTVVFGSISCLGATWFITNKQPTNPLQIQENPLFCLVILKDYQ